jgi:hypothetical protein
MPISKNFNVIFIHIPKTGGTSVEKMLDMSRKNNFYTTNRKTEENIKDLIFNNFSEEERLICSAKNMQHFTLIELKKLLDSNFFNNAFKFSIVRNPYHRLISEYFFALYIAQYNHLLTNIREECPTFPLFVQTQLNLPKLQRIQRFDGHLETQNSFLLDENGTLNSIDKIYKLETEMQDCLDFCRQRANINIMNIHAREGNYDKNIAQYYDAETKDLVYNFYKQDFDLFGYNKDL